MVAFVRKSVTSIYVPTNGLKCQNVNVMTLACEQALGEGRGEGKTEGRGSSPLLLFSSPTPISSVSSPPPPPSFPLPSPPLRPCSQAMMT